MITKKLKALIEKMGGDPAGVKTKAPALDCLCNCEMGGGAEIIDAEINPEASLGFTLPQSQSQIYEKVSDGKQVTVKGSVDGTDILFFRPCLINETFVTFYATSIKGDFRGSSVEFFAFHLWADDTESFGADLVRVTNFAS